MKRRHKVKVVEAALRTHLFGTPLSAAEYNWIADSIVDALKTEKKRRRQNEAHH